jgi:hypothetical protein
MSKLQKKPSALKRGHPTLQNMNFYKFFLLLWVIFALLDPDPNSGSGSTDLIESGSNPEPDPQPCRQVEQTSAPASPASTPAVTARAADGRKRPAGAIKPGPVIIIPRQQIMELGNNWQKKWVPIAPAQDQKKLSDASPGKQRSNAKVGEVITGAFSLIS